MRLNIHDLKYAALYLLMVFKTILEKFAEILSKSNHFNEKKKNRNNLHFINFR